MDVVVGQHGGEALKQAPVRPYWRRMGEWSTTSVYESSADARAIWDRAYADASAYPRWNPEIAEASLVTGFRLGGRIKIRFTTGARLTFRIVELEDGTVFTDEARLPGARMGHRHELAPRPGGGTTLTNTIYVRGPLSAVWARLVGRRAAAALPEGQRLIERLAGG
jgi:hypothetical protein